MDTSLIVTVDVGGTIFRASKEILCRSDFFRAIFKDCVIPDGPIFIDRSPHMFKHVLSLLRDSNYHYPKKYEKELKYYLIDVNRVVFYDLMEGNKILLDHFNLLHEEVKELEFELASAKLRPSVAPSSYGYAPPCKDKRPCSTSKDKIRPCSTYGIGYSCNASCSAPTYKRSCSGNAKARRVSHCSDSD